MSTDYWWGVATPLLLALVAFLGAWLATWLRWWGDDPDSRLGRGRHHEFEELTYSVREGRETWRRYMHVHYWPPDTPWWLIKWAERFRIRACLRDPKRRRSQ